MAGQLDSLALLFKPDNFRVTDRTDPELYFQEWSEYVERFKKFLKAVPGALPEHSADHANCGGCSRAKVMLELLGGKEVEYLFKHVGIIEDEDTWDMTLEKINNGIKKQTNQAVARFKLFMQLSQGDKPFSEWYDTVREQAKRCDFSNYTEAEAARDAILFNTSNNKLQQKILTENLDYDAAVKYGLSNEQSRKKIKKINEAKAGDKVEDANRISRLEKDVEKMKTKKKPRCKTCSRQHEGVCFATKGNKTCFDCGETGHWKGAQICKGKPKNGNNSKGASATGTKPKKNFKGKSRKVSEDSESSDGSDTESVGRLEELKSAKEERANHVELKPGDAKERMCTINFKPITNEDVEGVKLELVVDTGATKVILTEKDWETVKRKHKKLKLKKTTTKFRPYGVKDKLNCIGKAKLKLQSKSGSQTRSQIFVVKNARESLLGLKEAERLGIVKVNPDGESVRSIHEVQKKDVPMEGEIVSGGKTQKQIDEDMSKIKKKFPNVFSNKLGRATKVAPVHVEIDKSIQPIQ